MTDTPLVNFSRDGSGDLSPNVSVEGGDGMMASGFVAIKGGDGGRRTGFGRKFAPDTGIRIRFSAGFSR
jgi:hypothetical protein